MLKTQRKDLLPTFLLTTRSIHSQRQFGMMVKIFLSLNQRVKVRIKEKLSHKQLKRPMKTKRKKKKRKSQRRMKRKKHLPLKKKKRILLRPKNPKRRDGLPIREIQLIIQQLQVSKLIKSTKRFKT